MRIEIACTSQALSMGSCSICSARNVPTRKVGWSRVVSLLRKPSKTLPKCSRSICAKCQHQLYHPLKIKNELKKRFNHLWGKVMKPTSVSTYYLFILRFLRRDEWLKQSWKQSTQPAAPNLMIDKRRLEDLLKQELCCQKCHRRGVSCMVIYEAQKGSFILVTCSSEDCYHHYELSLETSHHYPHVKTKASEVLTQLSVAGHLACISLRQFKVFSWLSGLSFYGKTQHQRIADILSEHVLEEVDREVEMNRETVKSLYGNSVAIVTDVQWQKPRHNNSTQAHCIFIHKETGRILHYLVINSKTPFGPNGTRTRPNEYRC